MLSAYVRDPNKVFVQKQTKMLKKYHNVSLLTAPDELLHTVCVDWHSSTVKIFEDASDAMNNIPSDQQELPLSEIPPTAEECVREAFEFLRRGHSLHHPACSCSCRWRSGCYCAVGTTGQGRSVKDIERELGVCSLYGLVRAGGETLPLVEVLVRFAGMTLYRGGVLSSAVCCVPPEVTTAEDIVAAARSLYPRPYICTETCMGDLARLETQGDVRLIMISPQQYAVFWRNDDRQKPADADLRRLWHDSNNQTRF
jgi:hypothetical protein